MGDALMAAAHGAVMRLRSVQRYVRCAPGAATPATTMYLRRWWAMKVSVLEVAP